MGEGVGVLVGCGVDVGVGVGIACPGEQDRRKSVRGITNKKIREFEKRDLIFLLLADRVLQFSQSFDLDSYFIAIL